MFVSILVCFCVFIMMLGFKWRRPRNFPPGPPPLPLLGNLLDLNLKNPIEDLERLRKRYGNVFSVCLGSKPAVVINGLQAMKEAMVTKSTEFAGRPTDVLMSYLSKNGILTEDYGPTWKKQRRFTVTTLKTLGKQSMEQRILGELQFTMETLENSIGNKLSPNVMFHNLAFNIIGLVLFGTRYDYDDDFSKLLIQGFMENSKIANGPWGMLFDSLPIIRGLPLPFKRAFDNSRNHRKRVSRIISEHIETREPGQPRDFVDCYLDELEKGNASSDELLGLLINLLFAATDPVSNTLLTGFLYLVNHPHIQERCQQEIDLVLEKKHHASYEDRHRMPYVQAVIHEIQRVTNAFPLSAYHATTTDTELLGYSLPKGTLIIQNMQSVLTEEGEWKFPHQFKPENFLDDHGKLVKPEAFMPFSAGARVCLGDGLARMELFLVLVTLLRRFKFIWPDDAGPPDYTPVFGATMSPKPYDMKIELRE